MNKWNPLVVWILAMLCSVPMIFGLLMLGLTGYTQQNIGATIFLLIVGLLILLVFVGCSVVVQGLLLASARQKAGRKQSIMSAFKEMRNTYWRILFFDVLAGLLAIPFLLFLGLGVLYDSILFWVIGLLLGLFYVLSLIRAPYLLSKNKAHKSIIRSFKELIKDPVSQTWLMLGVIGWFLVPIVLWVVLNFSAWSSLGLEVRFVEISSNIIVLLMSYITFMPVYLASPSPFWIRVLLLLLNIGAVISAHYWVARELRVNQ